MAEINPNPLPAFRVLYNLPPDTWLVINMGGRGGAKSHEVSKFSALKAISEKKRIAILRDQQSTIEQSILNEIRLRFNEIDDKAGGYYSRFFDFQKHGMIDRSTKKDLVFTKGFQTQNTAQKAALKSLSDIDIAVVEEAEDIRDEQKFNTFSDSIRKSDSVIIVNLNTPDKNHWIIKRHYVLDELRPEDFEAEQFTKEELEGYFQATPKNNPGVVYTFTTYLDNYHLPKKIVDKYRAYGDKASEYYDRDYYLNSILGLVSEGKKGRIYRNWKRITYAEFKDLPYRSIAGHDFGYSNDPNATIEVKIHNRKIWIRKVLYKTEMSDGSTAQVMLRELPYGCEVYCDSAEPKSIRALQEHGVNALWAVKGPDSIDAGIKEIKSYEVYYVEDNDLENEYVEYSWALDVNKQPTDKPEDKNNHLMDALRYAVHTYSLGVGQTSSYDD